MTSYAAELDFALDAARRGARIALGHFGKDPGARRKADGTWVTEADWAAESQIRLRIARTFPDHNVLGEEEGLTAAGGGVPVEGAPTWVVDPIDGTNNFMAGIPIWATLLGLQVDGRNAVGVVCAPALEETYYGALGAGARLNGSEVAVDPVDDLADATVVFADAGSLLMAGWGDLFEALSQRSFRTRGFGDFWGHMLVARGSAHVMVEPELRVWDVAALEPIVSEAGGRLTTLAGGPWADGESCLTTNGALHEQVLALARGAD